MGLLAVSDAASGWAGTVHSESGLVVPHDAKWRLDRAELTLQSAGRMWWRSVLSGPDVKTPRERGHRLSFVNESSVLKLIRSHRLKQDRKIPGRQNSLLPVPV